MITDRNKGYMRSSSLITLMSGSVDEPWSDGVDISLAGDAYFDSRTKTMSVYDKDGSVAALAEGARQHFNLDSRGEVFDRAARMYLAHLLDTNDDLPDLREQYGVTAAIPPREWMYSFERVHVEPVEGEYGTGSIGPKTVETVKEMVLDVVEDESTPYESQSDFIVAALEWITLNQE